MLRTGVAFVVRRHFATEVATVASAAAAAPLQSPQSQSPSDPASQSHSQALSPSQSASLSPLSDLSPTLTLGKPALLRRSTPSASASVHSKPSNPKSRLSRLNRTDRPAALTMTSAAVARLHELLSGKPDALGIRIGVRRRGCNGLSYTMNYADAETVKLDEVVEEKGVRVYLDSKAFMFIVGSQLDFAENDIQAEFVFRNPNAKGSCGCGESFNV